jgi:hypothetical protein
VVQAREWITVEVLCLVSDRVFAECKWFPTPAEFLEWCVAVKPKTTEEIVDASRLLATFKNPSRGSSMARAIETGNWDRGSARGRLISRGNNNPTTEEINSELSQIPKLRATLEVALSARLGHCLEGHK